MIPIFSSTFKNPTKRKRRSFTPITNAVPLTLYTSNKMYPKFLGLELTDNLELLDTLELLPALNADSTITVSAGTEYSLDGGAWTSNPGVWGTSRFIQIRGTSTYIYEATETFIVTIGKKAFNFLVTTRAETEDDLPIDDILGLWLEPNLPDTKSLSVDDYWNVDPTFRDIFYTVSEGVISLVDTLTAVEAALLHPQLNSRSLVGKSGSFVALYRYDADPVVLERAIKVAKETVAKYYISSSGSDTNNGLSLSTPFATFAKLSTVIQPGDWVYLVRGSYWRETFDFSALGVFTILESGEGATPVIDCSEQIPAGLWTPHATYAGVYQCSWDVEQALKDQYTYGKGKVIVNRGANRDSAELLYDITSLGTYSYADSSHATYWLGELNSVSSGYFYDWLTNILYLKAPGLADPSIDGMYYSATFREFGLTLGTGTSCTAVHTKMQGHNDGSTICGDNIVIKDSLIEQGHTHNLFVSGTTIVDNCFLLSAREAEGGGAASMLVAYNTSIAGKTLQISRSGILADAADGIFNQEKNVVLVSHAADSSQLQTFILDNGSYISGFSVAPPQGNIIRYTDCYLRDVLCFSTSSGHGTDPSFTMRRCLYKNTRITVGDSRPPNADFFIDDSVLYMSVGKPIFTLYSPSGKVLSFEKSVMIHTGNEQFLYPSGTIPSQVVINRSIVINPTRHILNIPDAPYIGDYNIFKGPAGGRFAVNWSALYDLAAWQAATGQDTNSVYLADEQYASFWLGDPTQGDFRINPNATCTWANGTVSQYFADGVTPLTYAGVQEHYDWATRHVISGPPTEWPDAYIPLTKAQILAHLVD